MASTSTTIDKEIIGYLALLTNKKKKAVLSVVKTFAEDSLTLWDLMPDEVRKSVERGIEQSEKGIGRSHAEVMKSYS